MLRHLVHLQWNRAASSQSLRNLMTAFRLCQPVKKDDSSHQAVKKDDPSRKKVVNSGPENPKSCGCVKTCNNRPSTPSLGVDEVIVSLCSDWKYLFQTSFVPAGRVDLQCFWTNKGQFDEGNSRRCRYGRRLVYNRDALSGMDGVI